jgi:hypothetical protein
VTGKRRRLQRSAGTRTGWGAAKAFFRSPPDSAASADQEAFRQGAGLIVTCFLRGSMDPYPRRSRQGTLQLTRNGIAWRPFWGIRRHLIPINEQVESVAVREAGRSEWNVKKGGNAFSAVPVPKFQVVVCKTDRGVIELSVSTTDVGLVRAALAR